VTRSYTQPYRRYKGVNELNEWLRNLNESLAKTKAFKTSDPAKQEKIKKLIEALSQEIKETSEKIVELLMSDETLLAEALE
jgi:ABC-type uncharacterized transport system auxiliary subunit